MSHTDKAEREKLEKAAAEYLEAKVALAAAMEALAEAQREARNADTRAREAKNRYDKAYKAIAEDYQGYASGVVKQGIRGDVDREPGVVVR